MTKVDAKGRVTLPKEIRERLGIDPGTAVDIREQEGRVVVEPEREPEEIVSDLEAAIADLERTESVEGGSDPIAERHREQVRRGAGRDE